jgi:hypothetical protein
MMNEKCMNCKCFKNGISITTNINQGLCRRHPPKPSMVWYDEHGIQLEAVPNVSFVDKQEWCAEWRSMNELGAVSGKGNQDIKENKFSEIPATHCTGMVTIENIDQIKEMVTADYESIFKADLGIKISDDGRVWICVNGVALLRFKPRRWVVR